MLVFYAMGIPENIAATQESIYNAAVKAGRTPGDIKLIAVTKTVSLPDIIVAVKAGVTLLGENRVQEAAQKIQDSRFKIQDKIIEWHFIGHLQKNKARNAVQLFHLIHAVDSVDLAEELNRQAAKAGKAQRILVQVKLSEETTKHGAAARDLMNLLERISEMNNLKTEGLMTMPPYFEDAEKARPYFKRLRQLRDEARQSGFDLPELSMGMSHDFEAAIEEGSTMVRIGTALFGRRT